MREVVFYVRSRQQPMVVDEHGVLHCCISDWLKVCDMDNDERRGEVSSVIRELEHAS